MRNIELIATYDSADTAAEIARALNTWFQWVMDGDDEPLDVFDDLGVSGEDFALDREEDTDWIDPPSAEAIGNNVVVSAYTSETVDFLQEMLESLGAFEVEVVEGDAA